jgi:glycosyltransferase involved in cell wall biosynthesis
VRKHPEMVRKVFVEPLWKMHSLHQTLFERPPAGYDYITPADNTEKMFRTASGANPAYALLYFLERYFPLRLAIARYKKLKRPPRGTDLTYSHSHLVLRKEPWVADIEYLSLLISPYPEQFFKYQKIVQRTLESSHCRKIICETVAGKESVLRNLDCEKLESKIEILPVGVAPKNFTRIYNEDKIKLLFLGSANILGEFENKGGREALASFLKLSEKYDNLELVIRSDVPADIRRNYSGHPGIRIIDRRIPWGDLEREFLSADIFLLPAHNTPFLAFLDAMSYELPIVTIDAWANPEFVEDGKTGLLVRRSQKIPYQTDTFLPNFGIPQFIDALKTPDPAVIEDLVRKTSVLIENPELRRTMGQAARRAVEYGKYSEACRNKEMKRIFDEALDGNKENNVYSR